MVIRVKENQHPKDIARALQTLYFKGDQTDQAKSRLDGVIIKDTAKLIIRNPAKMAKLQK
jgi:hypothetical protein